VNEVAQAAVPAVFEAGDPAVCGALAREYAQRRELALALSPLPVHRPEGGVYLCPACPKASRMKPSLCAPARTKSAHSSGYYYNLPSHLVMTCVSAPERLLDGLGGLRRVVGDK
jgi:aspartate/methionine/tyrosine aminotransferase